MKHKIWIYHLLGIFPAAISSISVIGCLITGFDLPVDSMKFLLIWCILVSGACALLWSYRYGGWIIFALLILTTFCGIDPKILWEEFQTIVYIMTSRYHSIYGWQILGSNLRENVDLPFVVLSLLVSLSITFCWCRRRHIMTALPNILLPVVFVFFIIDTVPDEIYLYLLILGVSFLLLTDWVRRRNPSACISLTIRVFLPLAAALFLLFYLNPRESYVNRSSKLKDEVVSWFQQVEVQVEKLPEVNVPEVSVSKTLRLRNVGPRNPYSYPVMRINAPMNGTIYLRGQDYDIYTGIGWESSEDRSETLNEGSVSMGKLTIVTYGVRNVLYIPYYATDTIHLNAGNVKNEDQLQTYEFYLAREPEDYTAFFEQGYTDLPYSTYSWAKELADEITAGSTSDAETVQDIGNYVRNYAVYDLSTQRMDSDWNDFAQWFLTESETGYCVHFATAATVLLRAAGIPARYVEGYMAICANGEDTILTNQDAHAWVEYYDDKAGVWRILEATPADEQMEESTSAVPNTQPPETIPEESITEPTIPAAPEGNSTVPSAEKPTEVVTPPGEPNNMEECFQLPQWIFWFVCPALIAVFIIIQAQMRISWKHQRWNKGEPNEMALYRWKQIVSLSRAAAVPIPKELEELALKAKFSQHTLSEDELRSFDTFRKAVLHQIRNMPLHRKLIIRWVLGIGQ